MILQVRILPLPPCMEAYPLEWYFSIRLQTRLHNPIDQVCERAHPLNGNLAVMNLPTICGCRSKLEAAARFQQPHSIPQFRRTPPAKCFAVRCAKSQRRLWRVYAASGQQRRTSPDFAKKRHSKSSLQRAERAGFPKANHCAPTNSPILPRKRGSRVLSQ